MSISPNGVSQWILPSDDDSVEMYVRPTGKDRCELERSLVKEQLLQLCQL